MAKTLMCLQHSPTGRKGKLTVSGYFDMLIMIQEKAQLSSELSTAEARSSSNFVLASKLAHVIGELMHTGLISVTKAGCQQLAHTLS